jgi:hypothetical protein
LANELTSELDENGSNCFACRYWQQTGKENPDYQNEGICRRNAPIAIGSTAIDGDGDEPTSDKRGLLAAWPRTFGESDWCGEWRPAKLHDGRSKEDTKA